MTVTCSAFCASKSPRYRAMPPLPFPSLLLQALLAQADTMHHPASPKLGVSQIQAQSSWSPWDLL